MRFCVPLRLDIIPLIEMIEAIVVNKETLFRIAIGSIMVLFGLLIILSSFLHCKSMVVSYGHRLFYEYRAVTGGDKGLFVPEAYYWSFR